ncbi:MAG: hypothetical protein K0R21_1306 [Anaerocolumna sp.]|jgi:hypothetical protein|nr:hypothetical protein [Anaerocolumna sp.]
MKKLLSMALILVMAASFVGCAAKETTTADVKMGRVEAAPHGTKSFAVAVAAVSGDKIIGASIDEYQFVSAEAYQGVPNSEALAEGEFGTNYKDPAVVLASKTTNSEAYSKNMTDKAGSTVSYDKNIDAIEAYVVGKTVAELEKTLAENDATQMLDAVSGATLVDTKGYVTALVEAAKAAK